MERLKKAGLAVTKDSDGQPLHFRTSWNASRIDRWIRGLLPAPFAFLDLRYPAEKGEYHWVVAKSHYNKLHLIGGDDLTGTELLQARGPASKAFHTYTLYFVSRYTIPPRIYKDWDRAMSQVDDADGKFDESDPSDSDERPLKMSAESEESTSDKEEDDLESDESVEELVPVRTSSSSKGKRSAVNPFEDPTHDADSLGEDLGADGPASTEGELEDLDEKYNLNESILEADLPSLATLLQKSTQQANAEAGPSRKRAASASHNESQDLSDGHGGERKKMRGWFSQYSWGTPPSSNPNPSNSPNLPQTSLAASKIVDRKRPELPEIDFDPWA